MPKKVNYEVLLEPGTFGAGFQCFRIVVIENRPGKPRVKMFNQADIHVGFGSDPQKAMDDFIRRNNSDVLDMIFDL